MNYFYFFSYGSNLLFERIRRRVPSVEVIKKHQLDQFELLFNKLSTRDGSVKANISKSVQSSVHGVIHRINEAEKKDLDREEGLGFGYELEFFELSIDHKLVEVGYYVVKDSKYLSSAKPFDWYLDYVKFGALENQFPSHYRQMFDSIDFIVDQDEKRRLAHDELLAKYK